MKFVTKLPLALALIVGSVTSPVFAEAEHHAGKEDGPPAGKVEKKLRAEATIAGPGITGEAHLYEEHDGLVRIKMMVQGAPDSKLTPGRHAVHFHETGACEPSFAAAKGHYDGNINPQVNPQANVSPGLGNHPYHLGDLPNLVVDENRKGTLYAITSRVTLTPGLTTLFDADGTAFIIHELEDKFLPDPPTKDAPGGPRIACGVIVLKK
ncbi:MAG: superoxide dismutase family protein [Candidatus Nitrotoga sp.]|nr:superoxide dismutase family protein [Candidatus Nitrotoga sp.]MDO9446376.1 superoxide dismutase family protein [Candidatus Nitrotoga sp.]MDP3498574.1 superoxide dismutase family protein [Candidatus Nitrotoga sp.]RFC40868.1 MAG: superoxide dismutase, Cu-Zn family [Candidatus Nitrotoga sp. CP45]